MLPPYLNEVHVSFSEMASAVGKLPSTLVRERAGGTNCFHDILGAPTNFCCLMYINVSYKLIYYKIILLT